MHFPKLSGERVFLSPVALEDAELWARWLNDLAVSLPLGDEAYITYGIERAQQDVRETAQRQDHVFTIAKKKAAARWGAACYSPSTRSTAVRWSGSLSARATAAARATGRKPCACCWILASTCLTCTISCWACLTSTSAPSMPIKASVFTRSADGVKPVGLAARLTTSS